MLAKITSKNQLTLPVKAMAQLGFSPQEEKYVDISIKRNQLILKPVTVTVEDKLSDSQWEEFRKWALKREPGDLSDLSLHDSTERLKARAKKRS